MGPFFTAIQHAAGSFAGVVQRNTLASTIVAVAIVKWIPEKFPLHPQEWWTWFRNSAQEAVSQRTGQKMPAIEVPSKAGNAE